MYCGKGAYISINIKFVGIIKLQNNLKCQTIVTVLSSCRLVYYIIANKGLVPLAALLVAINMRLTYSLVMIKGVDVLEGDGGHLRGEGALHAHRQRQALLQGGVRLRTLILVLVIVTHLCTTQHKLKTLSNILQIST